MVNGRRYPAICARAGLSIVGFLAVFIIYLSSLFLTTQNTWTHNGIVKIVLKNDNKLAVAKG